MCIYDKMKGKDYSRKEVEIYEIWKRLLEDI